MVYAANAGLIINGAAIVARFKHAERAGEATAYAAWMGGQRPIRCPTRHVNEARATCWSSAR
jgi:N-dimethylarginine dimethylaminohydrolase